MSSVCEQCPAGYWTPEDDRCRARNATNCSTPHNNTFLFNNNVATTAARSAGSACLDCAPGFWRQDQAASSTVDGVSANVTCTACHPGTFKPEPGPHRCTLCANGSYSLDSGANSSTSCLECPVGTYSVHGEAAAGWGGSASAAQAAPRGANCSACPAGSFAPNAGSSTCSSDNSFNISATR